MKICCLQFAPQLGDVENNLNRADAVLSKASPVDLESLDLLVLPEMAFTGCNFHSLNHIMPFLEPSGSGITSLWARSTALKYNCHVAVGYPEKVDTARHWPASPEYYNSMILCNGDGETVATYRKTSLFPNDEKWALEGPGFFDDDEVGDLGQIVLGISMDINPPKFETAWHAFEFAFHVLHVEANLVIVSMSWLTREDPTSFTRFSEEPDMEALAYWVSRLEPIIRAEDGAETIVVFCNRCGAEESALYAGTSAVLGIKDGEVCVYGLLGRGVKEALIVDTDQEPFAKLISRPEENEEEEVIDVPSWKIPEHNDDPVDEKVYDFDSEESLTGSTDDEPVSPRHIRERRRDRRPDLQAGRPERSPLPSPRDNSAPIRRAYDVRDRVEDRVERTEIFEPIRYDENAWRPSNMMTDAALSESPITTDSPSDTGPSPISARPKLAIETGPNLYSMRQSTAPAALGAPAGVGFSVLTPPPSGHEEFPVAGKHHYQVPASAAMYTPEEPVWPFVDGPGGIESRRAPSRTGPSRPASRMQELKREEISSPIKRSRTPNFSRVRVDGPWSAIEPPPQPSLDPIALRSQSAFDPKTKTVQTQVQVQQPQMQEVQKSLRPRKASRLDAVKADEAEDWYRAEVTSSIHIIASPSVFQTSFPPNVMDERLNIGNVLDVSPVREQVIPPNVSMDERLFIGKVSDVSPIREQVIDVPRPKTTTGYRERSKSGQSLSPTASSPYSPSPYSPLPPTPATAPLPANYSHHRREQNRSGSGPSPGSSSPYSPTLPPTPKTAPLPAHYSHHRREQNRSGSALSPIFSSPNSASPIEPLPSQDQSHRARSKSIGGNSRRNSPPLTPPLPTSPAVTTAAASPMRPSARARSKSIGGGDSNPASPTSYSPPLPPTPKTAPPVSFSTRSSGRRQYPSRQGTPVIPVPVSDVLLKDLSAYDRPGTVIPEMQGSRRYDCDRDREHEQGRSVRSTSKATTSGRSRSVAAKQGAREPSSPFESRLPVSA